MPGVARRFGNRYLFIIDLAIIGLSIVGAMLLRFDSLRFSEQALIYFPAALFPLLVRPPINVLGGLYSRAWAYASVGELARIFVVVAIGSVVGIFVFYLVLSPLGVAGTVTEAGRFPRSFFVLEGMLTLAGMGGMRFLIRAASESQGWRPGGADRRARSAADGSGPVPTLVYGAGDVGATVLRTIGAARDGLGMRVVGLLDDDRSKRNQVLRGQRVLGAMAELEEIARVTGARRLLIAIPTASGDVVRRAVEDATRLGLETRTVPAIEELVSGRLGAAAIREVEVTDLLRREPVVMNEAALRRFMAGRTVLVTGAGGSIGSELSRQVFDLDPARLVLLDRAEGPLYDIERELALLAGRDSGTASRGGRSRAELVTRLANVGIAGRDAAALRRGPAGHGPARGRLQARADDGGPPGRCGLHEHRGHAGRAARLARIRRRAVRPGLDRQGGRAELGHGRDQAARRARGRVRRASRPAGATWPFGSGTCWDRRAASSRSSSASSARACR